MSLLPPPLPSLSHYYLQQPDVNLASLLLRAAALGHTSVIQELMQKNPELDVNSQDEDGRTALTWAAMMGREEVGWVLASRGAKINVRDHGK
jgi:ankyrin repeat protein